MVRIAIRRSATCGEDYLEIRDGMYIQNVFTIVPHKGISDQSEFCGNLVQVARSRLNKLVKSPNEKHAHYVESGWGTSG